MQAKFRFFTNNHTEQQQAPRPYKQRGVAQTTPLGNPSFNLWVKLLCTHTLHHYRTKSCHRAKSAQCAACCNAVCSTANRCLC